MFAVSFVSMVIVACVLATKKRKYKNVSHIAWITPTLALALGSILASIIALSGIVVFDFCGVLLYSEKEKTTVGMTNFYPEELNSFFDHCLFTSEEVYGPSISPVLGIDQTTAALIQMSKSANEFIYQTE